MPVTIYYDKDADLAHLKGKKVAVIGYGSQGHAHALNLRDSGVDVVVAELSGTANYDLACQHGFQPLPADEATAQADLVIVTLPDEVQPQVYDNQILPKLTAGKAIGFCHGFNIHFEQIVPPEGVDVIMIAPKGPGSLLRTEFEQGRGIPCLLAVQVDATGRAKQTALAWARGIGGGRAGIIETTFADETETDLFGEQVVLCGGVTELVKAGFDTLVKAGYEPELAYFECMHELKLIVDLFHQGGISYMWKTVSNTAEYGGLTRGRRIITDETRQEMVRILQEIKDGRFAREWIAESQSGRAKMDSLAQSDQEHQVEGIGKNLRAMMSWIETK
jgi:ketol-acid reductoisomerase